MPGRKASEEQRTQQILEAAFEVASRERLEGVTGQRVAEEAKLSKGLVFFHFESREALLVALLDWLLDGMRKDEEEALEYGAHSEGEALFAIVERRLQTLTAQREKVELFFDFWVMGTRHAQVKKRIREALDRYRDQLAPAAQSVINSAPERFKGVTAHSLATVAASFIEGVALQAVIHPERLNVPQLVAALKALVPSPTPERAR